MLPELNSQALKGVVSALSALTQPFTVTLLDAPVYYYCVSNVASYFRTDGKRISFQPHGIAVITTAEDQEYLEQQIKEGTLHIRKATPEEILAYKMKVDPKSAIQSAITEQSKEDMLKDLLAKIVSGTVKPGSTEDQLIKQLQSQSQPVKLGGIVTADKLISLAK